MSWNPATVRAREGLRLTDAEKQTIHDNFAPLTPDQIRADGVFEGGGVLGVAFLGALQCLAEIGLKWCDLAGTSAGAITAGLLAADYTIDEMDILLGDLDYSQFVSTKTSRFILTGDPSDDIGDDLLRLLTFLYVTKQVGEYTTKPFHDWLVAALKKKQVSKFADIEAKGRQFKVVASDINNGLMLVLPDSLAHTPYSGDPSIANTGPAQFEVAEAVRLSMSIPLFFEPGKLAGCTIVDGGITSNFPLWIYDSPPGQEPPYPTFGLRLVDKEPAPTITNAIDLLKGMLETMRFAHDRFYLQDKDLGRVINIDLTGLTVTATSFNLTNADKDALFTRGYKAARDFLLTKWSWKKHLAARGFPKA